jgi:hypothetical protein
MALLLAADTDVAETSLILAVSCVTVNPYFRSAALPTEATIAILSI